VHLVELQDREEGVAEAAAEGRRVARLLVHPQSGHGLEGARAHAALQCRKFLIATRKKRRIRNKTP
jgi:hypothetical protein